MRLCELKLLLRESKRLSCSFTPEDFFPRCPHVFCLKQDDIALPIILEEMSLVNKLKPFSGTILSYMI